VRREDRPLPTRFSLQIWPESGDEGKTEWRGKVHHLATGNSRYFRDWATMLAFLERASTNSEGGEPDRDIRIE